MSEQEINNVNAPDDTTQDLLLFIKKRLKKKYPDGKLLKAFHAKGTGVVKARFEVLHIADENLRVGLFKEPAIYDAWIRFSNASPNKESNDADSGIRGMAIKVCGILPGNKRDNNASSFEQDFILQTSPVFFSGKPSLQLDGVKLALGNWASKFIHGSRIVFLGLKGMIKQLKANFSTPNVLEEMYFSVTPYSYGDRAVKWHTRPLKLISTVMPDTPDRDFLSDVLKNDLSAGDTSFSFFAQFHESEKTEPIEDLTVVWKTEFHQLATITIMKQSIDSRIEEIINFSPGNALPDHQPKGEINQIRKKLYTELAKDRLSNMPGAEIKCPFKNYH